MKNVLSQYPALRASIYAVVAGALGVAAVFGFVTQDQVDSVLANAGLGLGAIGSLLALLNLSGKKESATSSELPLPVIDYDLLAAKVQQHRLPSADQMPTVSQTVSAGIDAFGDRFVRDATATVEDLRRQAEQAFGEYRGR
ncbi:hypothetical protein [Rhodococcoides fascians]|uniref:hypothetical protein n=1 Tax=Rhodococcoides fascians TaxID=1828 RepID=UPI00050CC2AF|nr:hypothetical protein [Rhodococcus fascians]